MTKITQKRSAGFSLVEVTLAIGVVSFAILSVLGSMSVGLSTVRDAKKDTTFAQITNDVGSLLVQTSFTNLTSLASGGPIYFDQAGRQVDTPSTALYSAVISSASAVDPAYPGAPAGLLGTSARKWCITVNSLQPGTTNAISSAKTVLLVPKS